MLIALDDPLRGPCNLTSEQGAGLGGSEGVVAGGDPDQERVLGGILQTEVFELSGSLRHLRTGEHGRASGCGVAYIPPFLQWSYRE